jgi:hypothetical protein
VRMLPFRIAKSLVRAGKLRISFTFRRAVAVPAIVKAQQAVATFHAPLQLGGVPGPALAGVRVVGSGWLSVAVLPVGDVSSAVGGPQPGAVPAEPAQGAQALALLRILLNSAAKVHGSWGSGRLLRSSLFSVLITNNGKVLIGAVTPAVLYADAAKVK